MFFGQVIWYVFLGVLMLVALAGGPDVGDCGIFEC